MKHIFSLLSLLLCVFLGFSQSGPAGVGSSADNLIWYDIDRVGAPDNSTISVLSDFSGNAINASSASGPTYLTNQLNGRSVLSFDGTETLEIGSNSALDNLGNLSWFVIYSSLGTSGTVFANRYNNSSTGWDMRHQNAGSFSSRTLRADNSVAFNPYGFSPGFNLHSSTWDNATGNFSTFLNSSLAASRNDALGTVLSHQSTLIGRNPNNGSGFLNGQIAEIIVFNVTLNTTQRIIIGNYLAAKFGLTISNDKFSFQATHENEVAGIGQEAIGDNHTDAQGTANVRIQGASDLGTGEYLMWGHDGAPLTGNTVEIPASFSGIGSKLNREWVADETGGDVGTVDITFNMTGLSLGPDPSNYRILTDTDGDFTNANDNNAIAPVVLGNLITFNNVDLSAEPFFTIANTGNVTGCVSDFGNVSASWSTVGEWDCPGTFPDSTKNASVVAPHIRIVNGVQSVNDLEIDAGGTVQLAANATLIVKGNLTIQPGGTLTCNSGSTIIFRGNAGLLQTVSNGNATTQAFANVHIANPNDVRFSSPGGGAYSISEGLHLNNGSFRNTAGLTFTSTAASQGHIARVVSGDFVGSSPVAPFTIERFKTGGTAGWNDLATAGIATTVADIDNELFISGVPGADGYAAATGGGGFISMHTYNNATDAYAPVTNVTNPMALGQGFEMWLGDNLTTWNSKAWNFTGTSMNIASTDISVDAAGTRWNLIGNPLPCFLNFSSVNANFAGTINGGEFWYFDTDSNQYNSRGAGAFIPPGQGFWVNVSGATTLTINPTTDIFSDRTTSEWFKTNPKEEFKVKVTNQENSFASSVYLRKDFMAFSGKDELDLEPLKVPDSRAVNMWMDYSGDESMVNYIDPTEEHLEVPLTIESGIPGQFVMNFQGLNKFDEYQCKNLLNVETNEQIEIVPGASYSFEVGENLDPLNFKLLLSKADYEDCLAPTEFTDNDIRVFATGKTIIADFYLDKTSEANIKVYNMLGQPVYANKATIGYSRESINLSEVQAGVYFVNININGTNKTEKVILK